MTKEQKFYNALQDVFIGARIEGTGGFVNLMKIKSNYYRKIEELLKTDIQNALEKYPDFKNELFDKLHSFFSRYFTQSGSIYFNSTPFHNNIYEKVYTDDKDVILFWKTQMLYYVKTDRIFRSLEFESDGLKFFFDVSNLEHKKSNEKRSLIYKLKEEKNKGTISFNVSYSERGRKTKTDEILKALKKKTIKITEDDLERAFRIFEKQSEVDFFINKNAKAFLQEQFMLWSYQYFWDGAKNWSADRVNELQILKDIAFKIIDFISQFEDELVKIWNKPKFVKNSNYVITLDRIGDKRLVEKIFKHKNIKEQIKEWQELGIVDENFKIEDVFENSPLEKGWQSEGLTGYLTLPYNPKLKKRARELRKAGNLSEVLLWNKLKQGQMLGFDFTRQQVIGNYIVDFHCPKLNLVIEIDGESHDFKGEYDEERDKYLQSLGLTVLHFKDIDIKRVLNGVLVQIEEWIKENTPSASQTPLLLKGEFRHLPIDTKYFKDLELEILSLFDDLDNSLDGWLIKSENYQALNTILPKFKEKVQTIYIDPPFNLDSSDQFLYRTNYKDANWATLLENRLRIARDWLSEKGSIFVRCDYNGNWIVRCLMDEIFGKENFRNEIIVNKSIRIKTEGNKFPTWHDTFYFYYKNGDDSFFRHITEKREEEEWRSIDTEGESWEIVTENMLSLFSKKNLKKDDKGNYITRARIVLGKEIVPREGRRFPSQKVISELEKQGRIRLSGNNNPQMLKPNEIYLTDNWSDIYGYASEWDFQTENSEFAVMRCIESTSNKTGLILDFFLGSGTTTAVAQKLGRKWIGVEMGEHFYSVVLSRMKKVLAYDKSGISKELKIPRQATPDTPLQKGNHYEGGGFFKYYELEQYEEALGNCKYEDGDLFTVPNRSPYLEYVFMKDEKLLKALEIDYENNKVKVDLDKLYSNIDIAETLSNLTGKWIKKIKTEKSKIKSVVFEDGTEIDLENLDYKLIKPIIWWE